MEKFIGIISLSKGQITQKWKVCYHLLTSLENVYFSFFFLLNKINIIYIYKNK